MGNSESIETARERRERSSMHNVHVYMYKLYTITQKQTASRNGLENHMYTQTDVRDTQGQ